MRKILALTWKEVYLTFTDRSLILIMIVAPLAISTIVGLAFGGFGSGGGIAISDIPVAVLNQDEGATVQGQPVNYGQALVGALAPDAAEAASALADMPACPLVEANPQAAREEGPGANMALDQLIEASEVTDIQAARAAVDSGDYVALIVIPPDFSQRLSPNIDPFGGTSNDAPPPTAIEVYANSGSPIQAAIVHSIVQGFASQMLTGNIAITAAVETLISANPLAAIQLTGNEEAEAIFACAFSNALHTVHVDQQAVTAEDETASDFSLATEILLSVGAAQAVFFALFTGQFGVQGIIEERRRGTLQRMIVSPTPRTAILAGNLFGTFTTVAFQITLLLLSLMAIASLIEGRLALIWGTNLLAIAAMVLALALCVSALGIVLVGLIKTGEQMAAIGAVLNLILGVLGGGFGFQPPAPWAYLSMVYWGRDGFGQLALGQADIGLHLLVLLAQGLVLFAIGVWLFSRRLDI